MSCLNNSARRYMALRAHAADVTADLGKLREEVGYRRTIHI